MNNCPFLGLEEDPQTVAGFPSDRNFCYRVKKPGPVSFEFQEKYCLVKNHADCPVFQDASNSTLPIETRLSTQPEPKQSVTWPAWVIFASVILVGLLAVSWLSSSGFLGLGQVVPGLALGNTPAATKTSLPAVIQPAPTATVTAIETLTPLPTPTETPIPTITATLVPPNPIGIGTPSGITPQLVLHRIVPGDNYPLMAAHYNTSIAAIQNINYAIPNSLWVDWIVVVPLNLTDVSALPVFGTYHVEDSLTTMTEVAKAKNVDLELMKRYNPFQPDEILPIDSWLLIPHLFQATKTP